MQFMEFVDTVMDLFPNAVIDEQVNGELVIATGLMVNGQDNVIPWEES